MKIYIGKSLHLLMENGLLCELEQSVQKKHAYPPVVVIPNRLVESVISAKSADLGLDLEGVKFCLPEELRSAFPMSAGAHRPEVDRNHLQLIMRQVSADLLLKSRGNLVFRAIAQSPNALLDAVLLLSAGGWGTAQVPAGDLRTIVEAFMQKLSELGLSLGSDFDWKTRQAAPIFPAKFKQLFIVGFDASHWDQWSTLSTGALLAQECTVWMQDWSIECESEDLMWLASWEQLQQGTIEMLDANQNKSGLEAIALGCESDQRKTSPATLKAPMEFLVSGNYGDLCQAIVRKLQSCLGAKNDERICIATAADSFVGRMLSVALHERSIAHHVVDQVELRPHKKTPVWTALLNYLRTQEYGDLMQLLMCLPENDGQPYSPMQMMKSLERQRAAAFTDRMDHLSIQLQADPQAASRQLSTLIDALNAISGKHSVLHFYRQLIAICKYLKITEAESIVSQQHRSCRFLEYQIDAKNFLSWVSDNPLSQLDNRIEPHASGVVIVPLSMAHFLEWDHVIFVNANAGVHPSPGGASNYLQLHELRKLNAQVQGLNRSASKPSVLNHDICIQDGHALCSLPDFESRLQRSQLTQIMRNSQSITLCAVTMDETDGNRSVAPSEQFSRCYALKTGAPLEDELFLSLVAPNAPVTDLIASASGYRLEAFHQAKRIRQGSVGPFTAYDFCVSSPNHGVRISASDWSLLNKVPELVFLRRFLRVSELNESQSFEWESIVGTWAHQILSDSIGMGKAVPLPQHQEWESKILLAGKHFQSSLDAAVARHKNDVPGWLNHLFAQALSKAVLVAQKLQSPLWDEFGFTHVYSEYVIDEWYPFEGSQLQCAGSIDLLMTDNPNTLKGARVGVFDMKTGKATKLSVKSMERGDGLQLLSYGLGLKAAGASEVHMGIVNPGASFSKQVCLDDFNESLQEMDGIGGILRRIVYGDFGHMGTARSEREVFSRLPLATIPVPARMEAEYSCHHV